jgi:tetratricopeptide (TPR) repeat protein
MKGFFGNLFGKQPEPQKNEKRPELAKRDMPKRKELELYKKGDVIGGKYEVQGRLGKGGLGVVYLVYVRDGGKVCALKTFRDELLADPVAREAFKKECLLWVKLEEHPFILAARWVEMVSGRLFVQMDYVAPDDQGRVNLGDHLASGHLETNQVLEWAIQFCLGMEHARAQGIECHRDIKPANILIAQNRELKISDFGLSMAAEAAWCGTGDHSGSLMADEEGSLRFSLILSEGKRVCGTPGYIAPEVYRSEGANVRSDIYSFGLVLWQMATGSLTPPFMMRWRGSMGVFLREIYQQQMLCVLPLVGSELDQVIARCLKPEPKERYGSFEELRKALHPILRRRTGRDFEVWETLPDAAAQWNNKGGSLIALSRYEEAIKCCDRALAIDPKSAKAWTNKGSALMALRRHDEAVRCFEQALAIDPKFAMAWANRGAALGALDRHEDAIKCYDKALSVDPQYDAWNNRGASLEKLGRHEEAIGCYDKALSIDPRLVSPWANKGNALRELGQHAKAIACYDKALAIDPLDSKTWDNKGMTLFFLNQHELAIHCYDKALGIDPQDAYAWYNKGVSLDALGRHEQEIHCYDKALAIDPRHIGALINKGSAFNSAGRYEEAIQLYNKALAIDPQNAVAWCNKGDSLDNMRRHDEAIGCYSKSLAIDPRDKTAWNNKIKLLKALGRHDELLICYDEVLAVDPQNANAWNNKGSALKARGRLEDAIKCYDKALAIDPHAAYTWFNKGITLNALGRVEDAILCNEKVLVIEPQDARAWFNKAVLEETLGRVRNATIGFRKFIELTPPQHTEQIAYARERLRELKSKLI